MNTVDQVKTHLEFYRKHQIAPVCYDLKDMQAHMERRSSLYLKLGLPPIAFRSAKVLEVAAGLGQNSLYLAHTLPAKLVLLEPNPSALSHIHAVYEMFKLVHTLPEVVASKLEDYSSEEKFDIVLCENWLGNSRHELSLLQKLSNMVAPQGALVLTTISPIGLVPNLLRRFLAVYLAPLNDGFERRTEVLAQEFRPHLDTLKSKTRNAIDWVQDNMINPAYFGIGLTISKVIEELGDRFEAIGSSPSFAEDWRWFKALHGPFRQFNQHFLSQYWSKAHNFLDYRESISVRDPHLNKILEEKAIQLLHAIEAHEEAHIHHCNVPDCVDQVFIALQEFLDCAPSHLQSAIRSLIEVKENMEFAIKNHRLQKMINFPALFGRETVYLSLFSSRKN